MGVRHPKGEVKKVKKKNNAKTTDINVKSVRFRSSRVTLSLHFFPNPVDIEGEERWVSVKCTKMSETGVESVVLGVAEDEPVLLKDMFSPLGRIISHRKRKHRHWSVSNLFFSFNFF